MPLVSNKPAETGHDTPFRSTTGDLADHVECSASVDLESSLGEESIGEQSDWDIKPQLETERALLETIDTMLIRHCGATGGPPTELFMQSLGLRARSSRNSSLGEETVLSSIHSQACKKPDSAQSYSSCSPSDVLDRNVQLATDTHLAQLDAIPSTSTTNVDRRQFGGQPPAEKHNAVELLWLQLLFQKERTEIHAERYKILHEKVRKLQIQNVNIATLKDQVRLLENENDDMQNELKIRMNHYQQLASDKHRTEQTFNKAFQRMTQEFGSLQLNNRTLQTLLVTQKQGNDVLKTEAEAAQSQLVDLMVENKVMQNEVRSLRNAKAEHVWLRKDMNNEPEIVLCPEPLHLKHELEQKKDLIYSFREKISALEIENIFLKKMLAEQENVMERIKSLNEHGIKVVERHFADVQEAQIEYGARLRDLSDEVKLKSQQDCCDCEDTSTPEVFSEPPVSDPDFSANDSSNTDR